jgi:hypothetical protein
MFSYGDTILLVVLRGAKVVHVKLELRLWVATYNHRGKPDSQSRMCI